MLGYTMYKYPDSRFSIALVDLIIPHSFSAQTVCLSVCLSPVLYNITSGFYKANVNTLQTTINNNFIHRQIGGEKYPISDLDI